MTNFYDHDHNPLTLMEWAEMFEEDYPKNIRVQRTEIPSAGVWVSTIWNGFDASNIPGLPAGIPEPIFETAVFPLDGTTELHREAHITKAYALRRHAEIVSDYRDRTL